MHTPLFVLLVSLAAPSQPELDRMNARFAPVELKADLSHLPPSEKAALAKMIAAARVFDALFLRQSWAGNETMLLDLLRDGSPLGKARLRAFLLNKGPWDRIDHDAPFIPGAPAKPEPGNFYPSGATRAEVEAWEKSLPEPERAKAVGFFTTVRRGADGKFTAVPYSVEYQGELEVAAGLLREAAALTQVPSLKALLEKRAAAFLSNDYYASDLAWMELDSPIDPTLGPYEVYEDKWFNAKAGFEGFVGVRDEVETQKLQRFSAELQELENHLPIDPALRNPHLGALSPITVVNSVFCSGDANHGVQTAAYNLPNDERITREKGTKRVMLKNVQEAKFNVILLPIVKKVLSAADQKNVSFEPFFTHILMHELMHGLGHHSIEVGGRKTTVRQELQDSYSALEEAKADISGLWALQQLIDKGVLDKAMEKTLYTTYAAGVFRSLRFGLGEAHGQGTALQLNAFLDGGGMVALPNGTFQVDAKKMRQAVNALTHDLLTLEAHGDKAGAAALLKTQAVMRPETQRAVDALRDIPVDIEPRFTTAESLVGK